MPAVSAFMELPVRLALPAPSSCCSECCLKACSQAAAAPRTAAAACMFPISIRADRNAGWYCGSGPHSRHSLLHPRIGGERQASQLSAHSRCQAASDSIPPHFTGGVGNLPHTLSSSQSPVQRPRWPTRPASGCRRPPRCRCLQRQSGLWGSQCCGMAPGCASPAARGPAYRAETQAGYPKHFRGFHRQQRMTREKGPEHTNGRILPGNQSPT